MDESLQKRIKKIKSKTDLMTTAHSIMSSENIRLNNFLQIATMILSVLLVLEPLFKVILLQLNLFIKIQHETLATILSGIIFILTFLNFFINPSQKSQMHKMALDFYSDITRKTREIDQSIMNKDLVDKIEEDYRKDSHLPIIPDNKFLKFKRKHLMKVKISKMLDDSPGIPLIFAYILILFKDTFLGAKNILMPSSNQDSF